MDINSINSYSAYTAKTYAGSKTEGSKAGSAKDADSQAATGANSAYSEVAATYESSSKVTSVSDRTALVEHLKAENQARIDQMQSLVTKMFQKQGIAIGTADDMWRILASGNFTADAATIEQAKSDIAEDGYWGVNQTSDRIFSFALALSGGDEDKMKEMVKAVEKGFSLATKTWGTELPSITSDTHSAIMDKFDNWFKENGSTATTEELLK